MAILVAGAGEIDRARAVVVGETSFHDVVAVEASAEQVTGDIQLRAVLFDCQSQTPSGWKPVWAHTSEVFAAASIGPDGVGGYVAGALDRDAEL